MAILPKWLNADLFSSLRDKTNALFDAFNVLSGGTAGQVLAKINSTDFNFQWISISSILPSQTGKAGKVLTTNGTTADWDSIMFDRQMDNAAPNASYPTSGSSSIIGSALTTIAGPNRDYMLHFSMDWARISTSPENFVGFYKNGTLLKEYHMVAITTDGQTQTTSFAYLDLNIAPGVVYTIKIRDGSGTNQVTIQSYAFIIDGTPIV